MLVLGGGITGLGVLRILARNGIPRWLVAGPADLAFASRHARAVPAQAGLAVPPDAGLAPFLRALPIESAVLIPCSDDWVRQVSQLDPGIRTRFPSSVPSPEALDQAIDKGRFATLLQAIGVPHPRSWPLEAGVGLDALPADAFRHAFLKPRDSQSFFARYGVKGLWVDSAAVARARLEEVTAAGLAVQLQEYVPGPPTSHIFIDGYACAGGDIRGLLVRRRLRMYPGDFGNSTLMVTIAPEEASEAVISVRRLVEALSFHGVFSVEFKQSEADGRYYALEMNARPWWYVDYAALAGMDVIRMAWLDARGESVPEVRHYQIGRRCVFPYYDWFAFREQLGRHRAGVWGWLWGLVGADQPVLRFSDPGPAWKAVRSLLRRRRASAKVTR